MVVVVVLIAISAASDVFDGNKGDAVDEEESNRNNYMTHQLMMINDK